MGTVFDERYLFDVPTTARKLSVGRTTVFSLLNTGELASITIGRRRLVPREELEAFIARQGAK